ncbi:MAG: DUF4268 domain-containing protein [Parasphingorhabdus sp.]
MTNLGSLEKLDLREIWKTEAQDFTPWLAKDENMAILAGTLGLQLEVEAQERSVGPFRADILCKDLDDSSWVLIENQLERTDHGHLGQLLTYASGLTAVTIIWIAARFTEEHRAVLDWLNDITDEKFQFFGLEVELWRIGESPAAPKFNIVSKPNEWSRAIGKASKRLESEAITDLKRTQRDYWEALHKQLEGHPYLRSRKPQPQHWTTYSIGRSGMHVAADVNSREKRIGVELYLGDESATAYFHMLKEEKVQIEAEIGAELLWREIPNKTACRIILYRYDSNFMDHSQWNDQHVWLQTSAEAFHKAFSPRVRLLNAEEYLSDAIEANV